MKLFKFSMFGLFVVGALLFTNQAFANDPGPDLRVLSTGTDGEGNFSALIINLGDLKSESFYNSFQWAIGSTGLAEWDVTKNPTGQEFGSVRIDGGLVPSNGGSQPAGQKWIQFKVDLPINYYLFRVCADTPNSVTESIENNNCSEWKWMQGNQSESPDLVAGAPAQTTAEIGVAKTFTSVIKNAGNKSTEKSFNNFFQIATDKDDLTKIVDLSAVSMNTLTSGASAVASKSHTFANSGVYYVRACADKDDRGDNGVITETNEGNNCSDWTRVSVSLPDLIASAPTTISNAGFQQYVPRIYAKTDTQVTMYSMVKNRGVGSTETTFTNVFISITDDQGAPVNYPVSNMKVLKAGESAYFSSAITFPKKGTYLLKACADKNSESGNGVIVESDENNNCGTTEIVVSRKLDNLSELSASLPSPDFADVGVETIFTSNILNQGDTSTGAGFTNLFQIATSANGQGDITDYPVPGMSALAPLSMAEITKAITFDSAGTYSVRVCADKNSSLDKKGLIEEIDEDNNCSGWNNVTVSDDNMTKGTLEGNNCVIKKNESNCVTALTLNVVNPVSGKETSVTKSVPDFNTIVISSAEINTIPKTVPNIVVEYPSTTFFLNHNGATLNSKTINAFCINKTGWDPAQRKCLEGKDPETCYDKIRNQDETDVDVGGVCDMAVIDIEFTANPAKVFKGKPSTLKWKSSADSCEAVNGEGLGVWTIESPVGTGEQLVYPEKSAFYKISCMSGSVKSEAQAIIRVNSIKIEEN